MAECPVCFETTVLVRQEPCGHELCAQCLQRIGRRCALCRAHVDFAESVHERNEPWEITLPPLQQPLLFADVSAPTTPELEAALRALCANRDLVLRQLRLQRLLRQPDRIRVLTQQLSTLETYAVRFRSLARRGELTRALNDALELEWSQGETVQHVLSPLSRPDVFRDAPL